MGGDQPGSGADPHSVGALARGILPGDDGQHPLGQHIVPEVGREAADHGHAADVAHHVGDVGSDPGRLAYLADVDVVPACIR